jgi:hypothetical protein
MRNLKRDKQFKRMHRSQKDKKEFHPFDIDGQDSSIA